MQKVIASSKWLVRVVPAFVLGVLASGIVTIVKAAPEPPPPGAAQAWVAWAPGSSNHPRTGVTRPVDVTEATLTLPAGEFLVTARVNLLTRATWTGERGAPIHRPAPKCAIMQGAATLDSTVINGFESTYDFEGQLPVTLHGYVKLATRSPITLVCANHGTAGTNFYTSDVRITAMQVWRD